MGAMLLEQAKTDFDKDVGTTIILPAEIRLKVDADAFAALCAANRDMRLERESDGGLAVMSPASGRSGRRNMELGRQIGNWNHTADLGAAFDSSTGFTFPDGSILAPDAAWIQRERWDRVPIEDQDRFPHVVPDFVAELRSPSDSIKQLQAKLAHYVAQGVRLGWLIDPTTQTVEIHRPGRDVEILAKPGTLSGEDVMPGLIVELKGVLRD